jgi:hypothetical protein
VKATATADNPPAAASCDARSDTSNESRADGGKSDDGDGDGNDNSAQATELPEAVPAATREAAAKIPTSTAQLPTTAPASPAATPSLAPQQAPTSGKRYWTSLLDQNNLRYCDSGGHAQRVSGASTTTSTSQSKEGTSLAGLAINFGQRRKLATNAHVPPATAQQTTHHPDQPPSGLPSYRMSMHVPSGDSADPSSPRASKTAVPATPRNQRASPFTQSFDTTPSTARTTPSASSIYSVRKPSPPPAKTTAAKAKPPAPFPNIATKTSVASAVRRETQPPQRMMPNLQGVPLCTVFLTRHGHCRYGNNCKYSHGVAPAASSEFASTPTPSADKQRATQPEPGGQQGSPRSKLLGAMHGSVKPQGKPNGRGASARSGRSAATDSRSPRPEQRGKSKLAKAACAVACVFLNSEGGCKYGSKCRFSHEG